MSDSHWEDLSFLADYGESSGTGPWIKLRMNLEDMDAWRGNKGNMYQITCCGVRETQSEYELVQDQVWRNDGQMLGFGETDASGCWVKFRVEPEDLSFFRGNKGVMFYWKFIAEEQLEGVVNAQRKEKSQKGPYGKEIQLLHKAGFFRSPAVAKACGSDNDFMAYTRFQPCVITGGFDWDEAKGEGRCDFAHVRRAGESGTGYKAEYSGIPLVHEIHSKYQHQQGETAAYEYYLKRHNKKAEVTVESAKEWFDKKAIENLQRWTHETLAQKLGVPSMSHASKDMIREWAQENDLMVYLPGEYRD